MAVETIAEIAVREASAAPKPIDHENRKLFSTDREVARIFAETSGESMAGTVSLAPLSVDWARVRQPCSGPISLLQAGMGIGDEACIIPDPRIKVFGNQPRSKPHGAGTHGVPGRPWNVAGSARSVGSVCQRNP
jgi:hypothetical protein